jgi:signal transduction histidine kinase
MAAEIAHEVGTPLNVIGGRARAIGKIIGRHAGEVGEVSGEITKNAGIIGGEVERIAKIIRQVLDFSRPRGPTVTRVRVPAIVAEAALFLSETTRRQAITVEVKAPAPGQPELPDVPGDPDQFQQVCLNLLMNAIHAMPKGGTLRIALERVVRRKGGLDLAAPAEYVVLEISDSGSGIPEAHRDKIFEPFFTTRDEGQGTGLGLAVSNGIVKDHDGWIEVESPRGEGAGAEGAVFRVYLPTGVALADAAPFDTLPGLPAAPADSEGTLAPADPMGKD